MPDDHLELAPWRPTGITPLSAPKDRPSEDLRWRPSKSPPAELPQEKLQRARHAAGEQCMNSRVPGYTGFIPSAKAEDIYGRTQAAVGVGAREEQWQLVEKKAALESALAASQKRPKPFPEERFSEPAPDPHPLGKSKADVVRAYWVPTIPGYSGFVPGKHAENIHGGGIIHTCKMAGRAIAERTPLPEQLPAVTQDDDLARGRIVDRFHEENQEGRPEYKAQHAARLRDHCSKQIPGYTGHVPRREGDAIYGATAKAANLIAANLVEDRIYNPGNHINMVCAPQAPPARKLRI
mmetsp:Transcript_51562/g.120242  ORF Transcript_51562/g.120242 Transcript_51562/m.120242 type:complete len:294 (+) Transcript_51562:56-937(+)